MFSHIKFEIGNRATALVIAALLVSLGGLPARAQNIAITGTLKDANGEPVAGALVKIRNEELGLGFLTVSQEKGRYSIPNLVPGKYIIQAFGASNQSAAAAPLEIGTGQQRTTDLVLGAPLHVPPREKRMTDADYEKVMPEGEGKNVVINWCVTCHTLRPIVTARKTREKWEETVDRMYNDLLGKDRPLTWTIKYDVFYNLERPNLMIDYLAKNFGPDTPSDPRVAGPSSHTNRNLPGILLKGPAAKYAAMEFSMPPGSMPHDIAVDSQGIAWVSERNTGMLGRFDPDSLKYTSTASPAGKAAKFQLNAIAVDARDQIWCVDDGPNARILQFNPQSGEFKSYPIPEYRYLAPEIGWARTATLRFSDGNVWGTGITAQRILRLNPSTGKIKDYSVPLGSAPLGLAVGGNKMIWYAAEVGNAVVSLDPATGRLTPHEVPTPRSDLTGMAVDAEGNLWVAATESGKLVKVDHRTGNVTEYPVPAEESGPYSVDVDTKRNLVWFSEMFTDKIGRFDPRANSFAEFPLPNSDLDVRRIEIDRSNPNRVWWSGASADKIGYIEVIE